MRQLSDKEMELVALISEECSTPGDVTARLKNLFAVFIITAPFIQPGYRRQLRAY